VPAANVQRLVDLLWEFDEKNPDDPSTWHAPQRRDHKLKELNNTGMLEIYNHQYLWDNRMEKRVYDAFVDIWDREDLWVIIDRADLNAPKQVKGNPNGFIHWDVDTFLRPLPIGVQGVLSLKKQDGDVGGFQCVPYWATASAGVPACSQNCSRTTCSRDSSATAGATSWSRCSPLPASGS